MPLAAEFDGQRVISLLMSDAAWAAAKAVTKAEEQRLLIGYSKQPGFARTSAGGLRHFAHRPGYKPDYEWQETMEHLTLKAELVRRISEAGWQVDTEVPNGPDRAWIADVLAEGNGRRIAFEVQWSPQTADKYLYRQQRYAADGVECVWIVRREPDQSELTDEDREAFAAIPIFPLSNPEGISTAVTGQGSGTDPYTVEIETTQAGIERGMKTYTLTEMIAGVLNQRIVAKRYINLEIYETPCEHCHRAILLWDLDSPLAGSRQRPEEAQAIQQQVQAARQALQINAPLAHMAFHRSGTLPDGYKSFICPHCKHAQGAYTEHDSKQTAQARGRAAMVQVPYTQHAAPFVQQWDLPIFTAVTYHR